MASATEVSGSVPMRTVPITWRLIGASSVVRSPG